MSNKDEFCAEWRASAHEAVPYSDEIPEAFLVTPEWTDGAIAQGCATSISITFDLSTKNRITVTDNGKGVTNRDRLISWASKDSTDTHHRYGHGSKKCLTKWNKDYNASWHAKYRTKDRRGASSSLFTLKGPYLGSKTHCDEDAEDETTLWPSGMEWSIEFENEALRNFNTPQQVFDVMKEVLRTRYSKKYFDRVDFILTVNVDGTLFKSESSKADGWKTFKDLLDNEVSRGSAIVTHTFTEEFSPGVQIQYSEYHLNQDGRASYKDTLQKEFPIYGGKNMRSTKLHTSLDGRIIELIPMSRFTNKAVHNSDNGIIGFADFIGNDYTHMPTPCTTKVSFRDSCEHYQKFRELIKNHRELSKCGCKLEISCKSCEFNTVDELAMTEHMNTHVVAAPAAAAPAAAAPAAAAAAPKYSCSTCEFSCNNKGGLTTHEKKHLAAPAEPDAAKPPSPTPKKKEVINKQRKDEVWDTYIDRTIPLHKCFCCKKNTIHIRDFICGHVKSEKDGGTIDVDNLRPICATCNSSMGSRHMVEYIKMMNYYI